jgi:hypothetical protein
MARPMRANTSPFVVLVLGERKTKPVYVAERIITAGQAVQLIGMIFVSSGCNMKRLSTAL